MKTNPFSIAAFTTLGIAAMIMLLITRFVMFFITPFIILTVGRLLYCFFAMPDFSIWWPVRGAFFLSTLLTLGIALGMAQSRVNFTENQLKKIPAKMVEIFLIVFEIQFAWHGIKCFFSSTEFIITDTAWIGDILVALICAIGCGIWELVKYPFRKKT